MKQNYDQILTKINSRLNKKAAETSGQFAYAMVLQEIWTLAHDKKCINKPNKLYRTITKSLKRVISNTPVKYKRSRRAFMSLLIMQLIRCQNNSIKRSLYLIYDLLFLRVIPFFFRMCFAALFLKENMLKTCADSQLMRIIINKEKYLETGVRNDELIDQVLKTPLSCAWFLYLAEGDYLTEEKKHAWILNNRARFFDGLWRLGNVPYINITSEEFIMRVIPDISMMTELADYSENIYDYKVLVSIAYKLENHELIRKLLMKCGQFPVNAESIDLMEKVLLWAIEHGMENDCASLINKCIEYDNVYGRKDDALLAAKRLSNVGMISNVKPDPEKINESILSLIRSPYLTRDMLASAFESAKRQPDSILSKWLFYFLALTYKASVPFIEGSLDSNEKFDIIWDNVNYAQPVNFLKHYWRGAENIFFLPNLPRYMLLNGTKFIVSTDGFVFEPLQISGFRPVTYSFSGSYALLRSVKEADWQYREFVFPLAAHLLADIVCEKKWMTKDEQEIEDLADAALLLEDQLKINMRSRVYDTLWRHYRKSNSPRISQIYEKLVDLNNRYAWMNIKSRAGLSSLIQKYHDDPNKAEPEIRLYVENLLNSDTYQENMVWLCVNLFKLTGLYIPYGKFLERFHRILPSSFREDSILNIWLENICDSKLFLLNRAIEESRFSQPAVSAILRYAEEKGMSDKLLLNIVCRMIHSEYYESDEVHQLIEQVFRHHKDRKMILAHLIEQQRKNKWRVAHDCLVAADDFYLQLLNQFKNLT